MKPSRTRFENSITKAWEKPKTVRERINLQKKLRKLITGNPEERLQAMIISDLWGHANVLPILKRGLKDSDSRVIEAAAFALNKHRGLPYARIFQNLNCQRPPRNVSLMR